MTKDDYSSWSDEDLANRFIGGLEEDGLDYLAVPHAAEARAESRGGLGDTIERVLSKMGITSEKIERVFNVDEGGCGCEKRKKFLNAIFPYFKKNQEGESEE